MSSVAHLRHHGCCQISSDCWKRWMCSETPSSAMPRSSAASRKRSALPAVK